MQVAEVVDAIDDPELLVAGCCIENLFTRWQDDQRRKANLCVHGNDARFVILHGSSARVGVRR
jgi:hypothetical protein